MLCSFLLICVCGQKYNELGSLGKGFIGHWRRIDPYSAAVFLNNAECDGQSQACALVRPFCGIKGFENFGQLLFADAASRVGYGHPDLFA